MTIIFDHRFLKKPRLFRSGEVAYISKKSLLRIRDETAIILSVITNRRLFEEIFCGLDSKYFYDMLPGSGVFVRPIVPTSEIAPGCVWPGDIDMIIIPYEQDRLLLHRTVAIEVKIIRASFLKQGKSPNEFGFHQAEGLKSLGFPYVAVAHLIVSDKGPPESWTSANIFKVLDEAGRVEPLPDQKTDMLPLRLMQRAFGRMNARCHNENIGLIAAYVGSADEEIIGPRKSNGMWYPYTRKAKLNDKVSYALLENLAKNFDLKYPKFFDNPRFDP